MSDYSHKVTAIAAKKNKLFEEEIKLIHKRKNEIAHLAKRCELLTFSDEVLAGLFLEFKNDVAEKNKEHRIQELEIAGGRFLKSTKIKYPSNMCNSKENQTTAGEKSTFLQSMPSYENS